MVTTAYPSAANHAPMEINSSTMVIRTQRSSVRLAIDWILTLCAWLVFLFLFAKGIWAVGTNHTQGLDVPFLSRALPSVDTLAIYGLVMLLQAAVLLLWALYNWSRFHGKTRRNRASTLSDEQLTRSYGVDMRTLNSLRSSTISVIHHAPEGSISAITHPTGTPSLLQEVPRAQHG